MSEFIQNAGTRKSQLKALILQLHYGDDPVKVRQQLLQTLEKIPYNEVVEVETELIKEGLPESEVLKLCDVHGEVLHGHIDLSHAKSVPSGHPVDVFLNENRMLLQFIQKTESLLGTLHSVSDDNFGSHALQILACFNELMDVDKHYKRKEYLVFPFLEKKEITGPPKVMWGKHDEIREQMKGCIEILRMPALKKSDLLDALDLVFAPALSGLTDMIKKEEEILFPMCMDMLTTNDWWQIDRQTIEFGYTLYDPQIQWVPQDISEDDLHEEITFHQSGTIQLPSGSFSSAELLSILNTLPVDITFVDKDDRVKYFSQGKHRIFARSRSIINRDVRLCHPPGSVHIVEKILDDFKSGRASHAPFWIQMQGKFIYIEYYALRDEKGNYQGTLEVSQDLTHLRQLTGEQRILSYSQK